jgi:hypothetical protein
MYIATKVRKVCRAEILDCLTSDFETKKGNVISYGDPPEETREIVEEKKPDVVGISVFSTAIVAVFAMLNNP